MTFSEFLACLRGYSRANGVKENSDADYDSYYAALAIFESQTVH